MPSLLPFFCSQLQAAIKLINGFFVQRLQLIGCALHEGDLVPPELVTKLQRLLEKSSYGTNCAFTPF